jgi:DNA polymerase elongation subunit (family B)
MNFIAKILLNSLYGRFGMIENFINAKVIHKDLSGKYQFDNLDKIANVIDLGEYEIIATQDEVDENATHNVSVAIAAAITAYSRIHMSQFKNNPDIKLYYTDTDSVYTDSEIDKNLIDNKVLGALKLENICKNAIFLAPKTYILELINEKLIVKIKGLKNLADLNLKDFDSLLYKDNILSRRHVK